MLRAYGMLTTVLKLSDLSQVTKFATISRRVHGPDHKISIEAAELLKEVKVRFVNILPDMKPFQALRYENDGEICVVQGPIIEPRGVDDKRLYCVESHLIHPAVGCSVIVMVWVLHHT
jgi:hypothetical protein